MVDPFVLFLILACAIAILLGALVGWQVQSWVYGFLGIFAILFAAVGGLVLLYYQSDYFADDEGWGVFAFLFYLLLALIAWIAIVVGWIVARAVRASRRT
jgi:hypothetical protein